MQILGGSMSLKNICISVCTLGIFAATPALADGPCGNIKVHVISVALSDQPDNPHDFPPHTQTLNTQWPVPKGEDKQYGGNSEGWIVTQGYPSNGGAESWEKLSTTCTLAPQPNAPATMGLLTTTLSHLKSGVGRGTGSSSDFDTEWIVSTDLPPATRGWSLVAKGTIQGAGVNPTCTIAINSGQPQKIPNNSFLQTFPNLRGKLQASFACSQGHMAIFPSGPSPSNAELTVVSDVSLSFVRTP